MRSLYSLISDEVAQKGEWIRHGSAQLLSEYGGSKGVLHQESMAGCACRSSLSRAHSCTRLSPSIRSSQCEADSR
jgi:hypothetical protein